MREPETMPTPAPRNRSTFVRLVCGVALMTLTGGSFFAGPAFAMDRAARQVRGGTFRSISNTMRLGGRTLDDRFTADQIDRHPAPSVILGVMTRTNVRAKNRQPLRAMAHAPSARLSLLAPQPGACPSLFTPFFTGNDLLASLGSRGPPTL